MKIGLLPHHHGLAANGTNLKIVHDGTNDAEWAVFCMTVLLVLLLVLVCYSRMWRSRYEWVAKKNCLPDDDIFSAAPQMNIKDLIEAKLKNLPIAATKKKTKILAKTREIDGGTYRKLTQIEEHPESSPLMEDSANEDEASNSDYSAT